MFVSAGVAKLRVNSVFNVLYVILFQENDFDFVDKQHLEGIKVGDSQAILDDEDLMNDQGSGPFAVFISELSGATEIVSSTQFASAKPVFPYTKAPSSSLPVGNQTGDSGKQTHQM